MIKCKTHAEAALVILQSGKRLDRHCGGFLGQLVVDDTPLSEKQIRWFDKLAKRVGVVVTPETGND
jgi:hypothetical protein